jgi:hypothetical protein
MKSKDHIHTCFLHVTEDIFRITGPQLRNIFTKLLSIACVLSMLVVSSPVVVNAQVNWKDRYTSIAVNDQLNPSVAQPTQSDYTVSVWEDERHISDTGSDIFIQRIDNETGVSQWIGPRAFIPPFGYLDVVTERFDGISVCGAPGDQRNPRAAYDGMSGVVVTWEDYRNGICEVYAQRIDIATGRADPNWPVDGIPVCQTGFRSERPRIVGTVDGAFITWIDYRNDPGSPPFNRDIFVQYIQSATATWPPAPTNWVQDGIPVPMNADPDQINPELDKDNTFALDLLGNMTQGVVVTYQDDRFNSNFSGQPAWTVFANRIDANGVQMYTAGVPPWREDVPVAPSYENQEYPRIVTTGKVPNVAAPSAIIVWQDMIDDPAQGFTDIVAQRLDPVGVPVFAGPTGVPVCQFATSQTLPIPTLWESGDPLLGTYVPYVTVGWLDYRDAAQTGIDIYGGLLMANAPGTVVNPQGSAGEPVCVLPYDQTDLAMDNTLYTSQFQEQTVFVWTHETGAGKDIRFQQIALPAWIEGYVSNGWPVTEAKWDQIRPQANRSVFVWQDQRRDELPCDNRHDWDIYCQTPGACTGPTGMKWRDMFAKWTFGEDAANFRFASDPADGSTFVVWDEIRYPFGIPGTPARIVFIQKFDKDGVPRWANNGVALSYWYGGARRSLDASFPDVCIDGNGGAKVVWQQTDWDTGQIEVLAAEVACDARIQYHFSWTGTPIPGQSDVNLYSPRITAVLNGSVDAVVAAIYESTAMSTREPVARAWLSGAPLLAPLQLLTYVPPPIPPMPPPLQPGDFHDNLHVMFDGVGQIYTLTNEKTRKNVTLALLDILTGQPVMPSFIPYVAWAGHDLNIDDNVQPPFGSAALFAYSAQTTAGGYFDVYVGNYRSGVLVVNQNVTNLSLTGVPGMAATNPTICSDSVIQANNEAGVLVAWNMKGVLPNGQTVHSVETNRFLFAGSPTTAAPVFTPQFTLATGLPDISHPDVARTINVLSGMGPSGVVVWEGGGESSPCNPSRPIEVYGQHVNYDASNPPFGPLWPQPAMIGPGSGNYTQTRPTVKASFDGSASVFWFDSQTSNTGVMGTRLPLTGGDISWAKENREDDAVTIPAEIRLAGIHPQPATSRESEVRFTVETTAEAQVSIDLYDMLGRRVAMLFEGRMHTASASMGFSPSSLGLTPGLYMLRARTATAQAIRPLLIVR